MEKVVKITWEGKEVEIVQRPLVWKEIKVAREESIVLKEYKGKIQQFRNVDLLDDLKIIASIKSSPFPATMESLDQLSEEDRYKLAGNMYFLEGDKNVDPNKTNK